MRLLNDIDGLRPPQPSAVVRPSAASVGPQQPQSTTWPSSQQSTTTRPPSQQSQQSQQSAATTAATTTTNARSQETIPFTTAALPNAFVRVRSDNDRNEGRGRVVGHETDHNTRAAQRRRIGDRHALANGSILTDNHLLIPALNGGNRRDAGAVVTPRVGTVGGGGEGDHTFRNTRPQNRHRDLIDQIDNGNSITNRAMGRLNDIMSLKSK